MKPTIQTQINLLKNTKSELRVAIMEKGVTVQPSDLFSTYPTRISQISTQSGTYDNSLKGLLEHSLASFTIPSGTEIIGQAAFRDNSMLQSVTIPSSVTSIGSFAFEDCTGLTSLTLSDSVTSIGYDAFYGCTGLTDVTIGSGITSFGSYAFYGCNSLTSITIDAVTPPTLGTDVFKNTNNCPIYVPSESVQAYKTAWPQYASRIYAQVSPYALFNSMVDGSVSGAFEIPDGTLHIGPYAFYGLSGITSVTVPDSVTSIVSYAFQGCSSMASITFTSERPPVAGYEIFTETNPNLVIYVPAASVDAYKGADGWHYYASKIQAIPT